MGLAKARPNNIYIYIYIYMTKIFPSCTVSVGLAKAGLAKAGLAKARPNNIYI